jgi:hypothetical protein
VSSPSRKSADSITDTSVAQRSACIVDEHAATVAVVMLAVS